MRCARFKPQIHTRFHRYSYSLPFAACASVCNAKRAKNNQLHQARADFRNVAVCRSQASATRFTSYLSYKQATPQMKWGTQEMVVGVIPASEGGAVSIAYHA